VTKDAAQRRRWVFYESVNHSYFNSSPLPEESGVLPPLENMQTSAVLFNGHWFLIRQMMWQPG
jgi:hypothetical protein